MLKKSCFPSEMSPQTVLTWRNYILDKIKPRLGYKGKGNLGHNLVVRFLLRSFAICIPKYVKTNLKSIFLERHQRIKHFNTKHDSAFLKFFLPLQYLNCVTYYTNISINDSVGNLCFISLILVSDSGWCGEKLMKIHSNNSADAFNLSISI